jgi:hypothetical protein
MSLDPTTKKEIVVIFILCILWIIPTIISFFRKRRLRNRNNTNDSANINPLEVGPNRKKNSAANPENKNPWEIRPDPEREARDREHTLQMILKIQSEAGKTDMDMLREYCGTPPNPEAEQKIAKHKEKFGMTDRDILVDLLFFLNFHPPVTYLPGEAFLTFSDKERASDAYGYKYLTGKTDNDLAFAKWGEHWNSIKIDFQNGRPKPYWWYSDVKKNDDGKYGSLKTEEI